MPSRVRALGEVLSQKLAQSSCSLASSTVKSARSVGGRTTTSSLPSRWRTRSTGGAPPSSYSTADESAGWPSQYLPRSVSSGSLNAGATGIDKASLRSTATTKSNVSSAHASGRYVRCWVTIDQHGEFRWAEAPVKASTLPEKEHSSNRNINTELSDRGSKGGQDRDDQMPSPAFGLKLSTKFTSGSSPSTTGARPTESISPRLPRAGSNVAYVAVDVSDASKPSVTNGLSISSLEEELRVNVDIKYTFPVSDPSNRTNNTDSITMQLALG
ncbi:hypothetical protein BGZ83_011539 [Gryganskiella cystojenkinii]|nr:hypothetical protein BGZ83_011539 [Gryganskiella cystojenkinii]